MRRRARPVARRGRRRRPGRPLQQQRRWRIHAGHRARLEHPLHGLLRHPRAASASTGAGRAWDCSTRTRPSSSSRSRRRTARCGGPEATAPTPGARWAPRSWRCGRAARRTSSRSARGRRRPRRCCASSNNGTMPTGPQTAYGLVADDAWVVVAIASAGIAMSGPSYAPDQQGWPGSQFMPSPSGNAQLLRFDRQNPTAPMQPLPGVSSLATASDGPRARAEHPARSTGSTPRARRTTP